MLHAEPFETHLLSAELCVLFIYFLKGNCIGLEYHIILSKIHIIVIIKTKIIDKNKSCSNTFLFIGVFRTDGIDCLLNRLKKTSTAESFLNRENYFNPWDSF